MSVLKTLSRVSDCRRYMALRGARATSGCCKATPSSRISCHRPCSCCSRDSRAAANCLGCRARLAPVHTFVIDSCRLVRAVSCPSWEKLPFRIQHLSSSNDISCGRKALAPGPAGTSPPEVSVLLALARCMLRVLILLGCTQRSTVNLHSYSVCSCESWLAGSSKALESVSLSSLLAWLYSTSTLVT